MGTRTSVHTLDEGRILTELGRPVEIRLSGHGASGYLWMVECDTEKVRVVSHDVTPNVESFGAGGEESFLFDPIATGDTTITFSLSAPWEEDPAEVRTIELTCIGVTS